MYHTNQALDWALTYLRAVVGSDIEENEEYKQAVEILERNEAYRKMFSNID
jgi:predicted DNA-binding protein